MDGVSAQDQIDELLRLHAQLRQGQIAMSERLDRLEAEVLPRDPDPDL